MNMTEKQERETLSFKEGILIDIETGILTKWRTAQFLCKVADREKRKKEKKKRMKT